MLLLFNAIDLNDLINKITKMPCLPRLSYYFNYNGRNMLRYRCCVISDTQTNNTACSRSLMNLYWTVRSVRVCLYVRLLHAFSTASVAGPPAFILALLANYHTLRNEDIAVDRLSNDLATSVVAASYDKQTMNAIHFEI